ncbi:hypothetical protein ACQP3F_33075, partial [Escherichia coli]
AQFKPITTELTLKLVCVWGGQGEGECGGERQGKTAASQPLVMLSRFGKALNLLSFAVEYYKIMKWIKTEKSH